MRYETKGPIYETYVLGTLYLSALIGTGRGTYYVVRATPDVSRRKHAYRRASAQATVQVCKQFGSKQRAPAGAKLKSSATVRSARIAVVRKTVSQCCFILLPRPCRLHTNVARTLGASESMLRSGLSR
jgi:hypothetical protein